MTKDIRHALYEYLSATAPRAFLIEEFVSHSGRLDVLAVGHVISGFEIKSDCDSLHRVESQLACFSQYCDTLTFVAGPRFALPLLQSLPEWCGVMLAYRRNAQVELVTLRMSQKNPLVDAGTSLSLLSKKELHQIGKGRASRRFGTKRQAVDDLVNLVPFEEIRKHVRVSLKRRASVER